MQLKERVMLNLRIKNTRKDEAQTCSSYSIPAQGHVNPLMHLSHKLAQHGCKVILQENMQELIDDGIMDSNGKSYNFHSLLNFTISDKSQKLLMLNFIESTEH
ncbi:uncharacterized protein DS421_2g43700 [Arachis hypogaea]|nr:uncharacterized protein DS421_2g43700 [Arachis hypogaea]